jgi:dihydrolipoamide dehydrogenase
MFLDKEIGTSFQNILKKQGIKFLLNHKVVNGVNNKEKGVKLNLQNEKNETVSVDCDVALVSIGRYAYTDGL